MSTLVPITATTVSPKLDTSSPAPRRSILRRAGRVAWYLVRKLWFPALLVGGFVLWVGLQRVSAGGAAGTSFHGTIKPQAPTPAATQPVKRFRVGTFNIQGGANNTPEKVAAIAKTLEPVDFCGLMEVRGNLQHEDDRSHPQKIAEILGRQWLFSPSERRMWADRGGNGIVSRFPSVGWVRTPLPNDKREPGAHRNVVLSRVQIGGRIVTFVITHLERDAIRAEQALAVAQLFAGLEGPAVLVGDLNGGANDAVLAPLTQLPGVVDALSPKIGVSPKRVDWILVKGLNVVDAGKIDQTISDHDFYWADLEFRE